MATDMTSTCPFHESLDFETEMSVSSSTLVTLTGEFLIYKSQGAFTRSRKHLLE